jgi:hypothetical protein
VEAGRRNRTKRLGLSEGGRERLRAAAKANMPWLNSTGPQTPEGKSKASANGRTRQKGPTSMRELRRELAEIRVFAAAMQAARARLFDR